MTSYFNPIDKIDLSLLPKPNVIEELNFETILNRKKANFIEALPTELKEIVEQTLTLESEPITILLQQATYQEMVLRQRINDACRATMLAFAVGTDLDHIGATRGVKRLVIAPEDLSINPPKPAILESDEAYRRRIQLAPEGYSCAGPYSAYLFYALSADSRIKDIAVTRPKPGDVAIHVLSHDGDGTSNETILNNVRNVLNAENIRPLNDTVIVKSSIIHRYTIRAILSFYPGVHQELSLATAQKSLQNFVEKNHRNGIDITLAGIIHALKQEGVQNVVISTPQADIVVLPEQAAYCENITLENGGENV